MYDIFIILNLYENIVKYYLHFYGYNATNGPIFAVKPAFMVVVSFLRVVPWCHKPYNLSLLKLYSKQTELYELDGSFRGLII